MASERSSGTFWSRRSRKRKALLITCGAFVALTAIAYALPEEQPESASAELTTGVVTTAVTTMTAVVAIAVVVIPASDRSPPDVTGSLASQ